MTDIEKTIKGLTHCTAWCGLHECQPKVGDDCPYDDESDCKLSLMRDALAMLKEQEPMAPVYDQLLTQEIPRCGKCGYRLVKGNDKYCCRCGQAVKWDDSDRYADAKMLR